jgi:hypothetical protein
MTPYLGAGAGQAIEVYMFIQLTVQTYLFV